MHADYTGFVKLIISILRRQAIRWHFGNRCDLLAEDA